MTFYYQQKSSFLTFRDYLENHLSISYSNIQELIKNVVSFTVTKKFYDSANF